MEAFKANIWRELQVIREMAFRRNHVLPKELECTVSSFKLKGKARTPQEISQVLNEKFTEIKDQFQSKLGKLNNVTELLQEEINVYRKIPGGGMLSNEPTLEEGVRQLYEVGGTPEEVWHALSQQFGSSFFLKVIVDELGLSPGMSEVLRKEFERYLETEKQYAVLTVENLKRKYEFVIKELEKELEEERSNSHLDFVHKLESANQGNKLLKQNLIDASSEILLLKSSLTSALQNKKKLANEIQALREANEHSKNYIKELLNHIYSLEEIVKEIPEMSIKTVTTELNLFKEFVLGAIHDISASAVPMHDMAFEVSSIGSVSYTHLTLPTNREV
eukprot:TRINITY_DN2252_c0_g1_i11.p1 TRINITY_DN2252_c0_g1~~TRINITY_DN2252_c0_g1_i11.p1  ORF type:complete len:333 (-),score=96.36 TRINITY_DN2252_c0_g1_i11:47-1045(-)